MVNLFSGTSMLWLTRKWNQKSCRRATGAGLEDQCNTDGQMWASKPCQLGRTAGRVGRGQGSRDSVIATEQLRRAEGENYTVLFLEQGKAWVETLIYHSSQSVVVCFGKAVLWSTNTCWAHCSQESKPSKQLWTCLDCWKAHIDKQAGEIRGTNLTVVAWGWNGVSQPVTEASSLSSSAQLI